VPSGALLGLDAVAAAAEGKINSVRMISRKPVKGLLGAAHLQAKGIDISNITEPMQVFSGTAAEAAIGFPENLNVAAALGLAGIGAERTMIEWADKVDDSWLAADQTYYSGATKREWTRPRWVLVTHMFNHQTHHRGQVHSMLTQAGGRPSDTDLPFMD